MHRRVLTLSLWTLWASGCGLVLESDPRQDATGGDARVVDGGSDSDAATDTSADGFDAAADARPPPDAVATDGPVVDPFATCAAPADLSALAVASGDGSREMLMLSSTTVGASDDTSPSTCACEGGSDGGERVFRYSAPGPGRVEVDTYGADIPDTDFDTALYLTTDCVAGRELACNDDTDHAMNIGRSQVYTDSASSFDIVVDSCGAGGGFGLAVRWEPFDAPGTCDNPIRVSMSAGDVLTLPVDLTFALDHGEPVGCSYCWSTGWGSGNDLVFAVVAAASGTYRATLSSTEFDALLHVRRECLRPGSEVVCQDDTIGSDAQVTFDLVAGETTYLFADACRAWSRGVGTLTIRGLP